jgi:arylsulfatase
MRSSLLLGLVLTGLADAQDRPNVVVMLADNVGYGDVGAHGAGEARGMPTPRIDELASESLRLTQYLVEPAGTPSTLQAEDVTLGELFKSQGYSTAIAGKWHLGASEQNWPARQYRRASMREPHCRPACNSKRNWARSLQVRHDRFDRFAHLSRHCR